MGWFAKLLASSALSIFGDSFLKPILATIQNRQNVDLEKFKAETGLEHDAAASLVGYEVGRLQAQKDLALAAMNHPIWWIAWALFVFPVGYYNAMIHFVSVYPSIGWTIKEVPKLQEQWDIWIVSSIFVAQATTGIVATIANRIGKAK